MVDYTLPSARKTKEQLVQEAVQRQIEDKRKELAQKQLASAEQLEACASILASTRSEQRKVQLGLRVTLRKEQDEGCNEWMTSERTLAIEKAIEESNCRESSEIRVLQRQPNLVRVKTSIKTRN